MPSYAVTDLGPFSNRSSNIGAAVNLHGDLVVSSSSVEMSQGNSPAFMPGAGGIRFLDRVAGDAACEAYAINNGGLAVGASSIGDVSRAVAWEKGVLRVLPTPSAATASAAFGVNEAGEIVGYVVVGNVSIASIWIGGEWLPLTTLAGADRWGSIARGINNRGDIVGVVYSSNGSRGFFWDEKSGAVDVGALSGAWSDACAVNERGQVVGMSGVAQAGARHAFLWTKSQGMTDLGTLPGGRSSHALRINNRGDIVGFSDTADHRFAAVLWSGKECIDLTAYCPPNAPPADEALAINESGLIVCRGAGRMLLLRPRGN